MYEYDKDTDTKDVKSPDLDNLVRPPKNDPRFQDYNRLEKDINDEDSNKSKKIRKKDGFER